MITCCFLGSNFVYSGPLSDVPLFQRCYTHLTGTRAPLKHPLLQQIRDGLIDPIAACDKLLDSTELNAGSGLLEASTDDKSKILRNLYDFHRSWFEVTDFATSPTTDNDGWQARYLDPTEPALVITRTLFQNNTSYNEVVKGNYSVRGLRSDGSSRYDPAFPESRWGGLERGDLLGIYKYPEAQNNQFRGDRGTLFTNILKYPYYYGAPRSTSKTFGAGVLGLQPFLIMNSGFASAALRANGGEVLQRRWARNSMQLLCRNLPTLRSSDVTTLTANYNRLNPDPEKAVPFRQSASCMACHATIDPMAALARNIIYTKATYEDLNEKGETPGGGFQNPGERGERYGDWGHIALAIDPIEPTDVSIRAENVETSVVAKDPNFYARPPSGVIRFRSYSGDLIETFISTAPNTQSSMSQLGGALASSNDLYVCAAKRYFQYFTGIDVNLSDLGDPTSPTLGAEALHYRDIVIELGLKLKAHQKLKVLIKDIMDLPLYKTKEMK